MLSFENLNNVLLNYLKKRIGKLKNTEPTVIIFFIAPTWNLNFDNIETNSTLYSNFCVDNSKKCY